MKFYCFPKSRIVNNQVGAQNRNDVGKLNGEIM